MLILSAVPFAKSSPRATSGTARPQIISIKGVVQPINRDERQFVIHHEANPVHSAFTTVPFKVKIAGAPAGLHDGDEISFQLHVLDFNGHWPLTQTRGNPRRVKLKLFDAPGDFVFDGGP